MTRRRRTSLPRRCWQTAGMLLATALLLAFTAGLGLLVQAGLRAVAP